MACNICTDLADAQQAHGPLQSLQEWVGGRGVQAMPSCTQLWQQPVPLANRRGASCTTLAPGVRMAALCPEVSHRRSCGQISSALCPNGQNDTVTLTQNRLHRQLPPAPASPPLLAAARLDSSSAAQALLHAAKSAGVCGVLVLPPLTESMFTTPTALGMPSVHRASCEEHREPAHPVSVMNLPAVESKNCCSVNPWACSYWCA